MTGPVALFNGAKLIFNQAANGRYRHRHQRHRQRNQAGGGILTAGGNGTYSGTTYITQGTFQYPAPSDT